MRPVRGVAALLPRISANVVVRLRLGDSIPIELRIADHGDLGRCGPPSSPGLPPVEPVRLTRQAPG